MARTQHAPLIAATRSRRAPNARQPSASTGLTRNAQPHTTINPNELSPVDATGKRQGAPLFEAITAKARTTGAPTPGEKHCPDDRKELAISAWVRRQHPTRRAHHARQRGRQPELGATKSGRQSTVQLFDPPPKTSYGRRAQIAGARELRAANDLLKRWQGAPCAQHTAARTQRD